MKLLLMMLYVLLMWLSVVNVVLVDTSDVAAWTTPVFKNLLHRFYAALHGYM